MVGTSRIAPGAAVSMRVIDPVGSRAARTVRHFCAFLAEICAVEMMAERFPRVRLLTEGLQCLSLEEQLSFLESRWNDLQVMFSPQHLPETRKWHAADSAAFRIRGRRAAMSSYLPGRAE